MADQTSSPNPPPKRGSLASRRLPAEGENGVFSQSWFPVALATELHAERPLGIDFLDGRIVAYREPGGTVVAFSAYCPHVGADLSAGRIVDGRIQCAFHHWEYDATGKCVKTGIGDRPPPRACLFKFPTRERYGIIWVFNGEEPLFELPDFPYPDDQLEMLNYKAERPLRSDPWVFAANTPDIQHLKVVHKMQFQVSDPHELMIWHDYGVEFPYKALHQGNVQMENTAAIRGTSIFYRWGKYGDFWRGTITGFGLPRPGHNMVFNCNVVLKGPQAQEQLENLLVVSKRTISEDWELLDGISFREGMLTPGDRSLARFLQYLRGYPRAHPSAEFIR
ncbi:Rieske 2Fe-2S domain-containing protein [Ferrovibrio sp.]|uniref:Rieske 2Fe-2S domain-containing protein n=1 Tax=Ferrovibrio sp. TaxID=1917215 RepID=UPI003D0B55CF